MCDLGNAAVGVVGHPRSHRTNRDLEKMTIGSVAAWRSGWKHAALGAAIVVLALASLCSTPAEARRHNSRHGYHSSLHHAAHHRRGGAHLIHAARRGGGVIANPGFAAIVVDANSGRMIYAKNENELRHPASVTKVMTLYLLFEQLEKGRLRLDSPLVISAHAAAQAPTKLGLAPGQTIDVESAIKAVVTKSANDIAAAIAENIAGDEDSFAEAMTRKAHSLGMTRTHYANASGLPNDEQITTAHDLAVLGRAIQDRFPRYYRYFSTHVFTYRGQAIRNHNHLLGTVEGVDGIKTGYTRASGFNLLTSVRRGGRHIVAVVLGGRSGASRDQIMAGLIRDKIGEAESIRTVRAITENEPAPAPAPISVATAKPEPEEEEKDETGTIPPTPMPLRIGGPSAALALASLPQPAAIPTPERFEKVRPAFVPGGQKRVEDEPAARPGRMPEPRAHASADGSTSTRAGRVHVASAPTTPAAAPRLAERETDRAPAAKVELVRPTHVGWMIQIGATDDAEKAQQLLSRARANVPASAKAFTEKVQKGKETLWRARFAGLEEKSAETACKALKRSGFSCFTTKN
jgi:D-alanyl-D-alanine carboxypeptidase